MDQKTDPGDVQVLIPGIWGYVTLIGNMDSADVTKLRI